MITGDGGGLWVLSTALWEAGAGSPPKFSWQRSPGGRPSAQAPKKHTSIPLGPRGHQFRFTIKKKKKNESRALWNVKQAGGQAAMGQNQRHSPLLPPTGKQEATCTLRNSCACSPPTSRSGTHACGTFGLAEPTRACSTHPDMPRDTRCTIACGCQGPRCQLSTSHRPWTRIHRHALGTTTKPRPLARPTLFSSSRKTGGNATLPSSFHLALSKP